MRDYLGHRSADRAYGEIFTVVHDLSEGEDLAWIRGAIWPPVGTVVELESPERHALVVGIRLVLQGDAVVVRVDVQDPGEGELIARDAATRVLAEDAMPIAGGSVVGELARGPAEYSARPGAESSASPASPMDQPAVVRDRSAGSVETPLARDEPY